MTRPRRSPRQGGFTLVQLAIALGVLAILAGALVPDLLEAQRTRLVEKSARDVALLHDTARWYYVAAASPSRWPGETAPGDCNLNGNIAVPMLSDNIRNTLLQSGYLYPGVAGQNALANPWGQPYELYLANFDPARGCMFGVATNVPAQLAGAFQQLQPQAGCGVRALPFWNGGTPTPPGFVRCWSFVPRPGNEMCGNGRAFYVNGSKKVVCQ